MTTAAALLPPPPRPPHDPLWLRLSSLVGWRLAPGGTALAIDAADGALAMAPLPGTARVLGEASGSLGGLALPGTVALDAAGNLWLLDRTHRTLKWFDICACRFVETPCGALGLLDPRAIAADRTSLYIADAGPPGRLLVVDARALVLRAVRQPPKSAQPNPWQPTAVAVGRGQVIVADAANGALHRFALSGAWRGSIAGVGAISRLAFDCGGLLYAVVPGEDAVAVRDATGRVLEQVSDPAAVGDRFPPPPLPVDRSGAMDLTGWCADAGWFDLSGEPIPAPSGPTPLFPTSAEAVTEALDSRIARCQWHRVLLSATLPAQSALPSCRVRLATTTAETELPDQVIAALPATAWTDVPLGAEAETEALILSPPGRYLWLRITLLGDGSATPSVGRIDLEFPRISLRRFLPAAFGADPLSAAFADRLLGIFDRGFRDIEAILDDQASLFDPRSTPIAKGRDMLAWLAGWVGVTLDRRWPEARRRSYLRAAAKLFACRGTWTGLRGALLLWLGWQRFEGLFAPPATCAPACAPQTPCPPLPTLVLEHWKLRRWLFLGKGRLGDAAELWGAKLLGRSQLDATAQTGVTRLDATRDPLRDPFHKDAHRVSVFVPAHAVADARGRGSLDRLLAEQVPAHVAASVVPVHPRMRIGIQASLGFDSVVGCWPQGIALGEAQLGRATVLPGAGGPRGLPPRVGRDARLRPPPFVPRRASNGEAMP